MEQVLTTGARLKQRLLLPLPPLFRMTLVRGSPLIICEAVAVLLQKLLPAGVPDAGHASGKREVQVPVH